MYFSELVGVSFRILLFGLFGMEFWVFGLVRVLFNGEGDVWVGGWYIFLVLRIFYFLKKDVVGEEEERGFLKYGVV